MASATFAKLNLKDQDPIAIVDAPASFEREVTGLDGVKVRRSLGKSPVGWALAFATKQAQVDAFAKAVAVAAAGDAVVWIAYPKQSSKRYSCEFNRDTGWAAMGAAGFEPVRMVAIDEDWSALRFRRAEYIKTLTRDAKHALSPAGKAKAGRKAR